LTWAGFVERAERLAALFAGGRAGRGVQAHRVSTGPLGAGNAPHLAVLVRAGPTFINSKLRERAGGETRPEAA
jgi:hypothetical protein